MNASDIGNLSPANLELLKIDIAAATLGKPATKIGDAAKKAIADFTA